ncbi:MAG: hypothetical protein ABW131_04810, partial [Candidatus Sedimenticola sp. 6PFRAG5]
MRTTPWMEEVERSRMPEPRDAHDSMDGGVRAKQDARAEERRMYRMYGQEIALGNCSCIALTPTSMESCAS